MISDKKLCEQLSKLFTNKKFMSSIMEQAGGNSELAFMMLGTVLNYYIAFRDENFNQTYEEINDKYSTMTNDNETENIVNNGFMTHSFNAYKKALVAKKGLNYEQNLSSEEQSQNAERRALLQQMEELLGLSGFIQSQRNGNREHSDAVYVCSPGAKTFHYSCKRSPERLYEGPLKGIDQEPVIVGETKSAFLTRILEKRIREKGKKENWTQEQYSEAYEMAKKVGEAYGSDSATFAMISNKTAGNVRYSYAEYEEETAETLIDRLMSATELQGPRWIFSREPSDNLEANNLGDLVTLGRFIPQDAVNVVECMDQFEMMQAYARSQGLRTGEYIDFSPDKKMGTPTLEELTGVIDSCTDMTQLVELQEMFEKVKSQTEAERDELSMQLQSRYGDTSIADVRSNLLKRKEELLRQKQGILDRDYARKDGIDTSYRLSDCLQELQAKGLMPELLESDEAIKNDTLQYQSDLHGSSHTRRVNFLATLIMSAEKVDPQTATLIRAFVKNHDIGRQNDYEDKEHGGNSTAILDSSPERLEGLTDAQIEQLKFAITEHSLSNNQNKQDLERLFAARIQQAKQERYDRTPEKFRKDKTVDDMPVPPAIKKEKEFLEHFLDMCKDSDKLDRVRLDPYGTYPREGLDVSRLSLESSRRLENIAYESREKILEILDIERELQSIEQELGQIDRLEELQQDYGYADGFEERVSQAKTRCKQKSSKFLSGLVKGKRLSRIAEVPRKIKEMVLAKTNKKENMEK